MAEQKFDLVVVGAGLVGASLALLLARRQPGLRIALVEAAPSPTLFDAQHFDPRVVALTHQSVAMLQELAIWPSVLSTRACAYTHMQVWDAEGTGHIEFDAALVHQPQLGFIVENSLLVSELHQALAQQANVQLLWGESVEQVLLGDAVDDVVAPGHLTLASGQVLEATLILAADGASSRLRELASLPTREWDYGHTAIVTTIRTEKPHNFTARQRFMIDGPLAFLPLQQRAQAGDEHHCSIVWSTQQADALLALDDAAFCVALGVASEHCLGNVLHTDKRYSFPLRQRHAVDYVRPGLALVGDAAHTIHPLAGQGVNLGLLDAQAMAAEVDRAVTRGVPLGHGSLLRRYQRARKADNLAMMSAMEAFKQLFGTDHLALRWARNVGMSWVNDQLLLKREIIKRAMGIAL